MRIGKLFNNGRNPRSGSAASMENARLRRENDRLKQDAVTDPLTGIGNRNAMNLALNHDVHRALHQITSAEYSIAQHITPEQTPDQVVFCFIDLEKFKQINDQFSHQEGDALLRRFAERLKSTLRSEDTCARLGGDEYAVVAGTLNGNKFVQKLLNLQIEIDRDYPKDGSLPTLPQFSIGYVIFDRAFINKEFPGRKMSEISHSELIDMIINTADAAMYENKRQRGNQRDRIVAQEPTLAA